MAKPVVELRITGVDFVGYEPGDQGEVRIILDTEEAQDVALRLPQAVLASLEAKLAMLRAELAGKRPLQ